MSLVIKKIKNRLTRKPGFTLAETLLAVLILLIVSTIVATGIPAAKNAYEKVILGSNAQILLSTAVNTFRNELGTAWDVEVTSDGIIYNSADNGAASRIFVRSNSSSEELYSTVEENNQTSPTIMIQEYYNREGFDKNKEGQGTERPLVSNKAETEQLYLKYGTDSPSYEDGIVTLDLQVCTRSNDSIVASIDDLKIKVLSGNTSNS